ncbi:MAG: type I DNA topoisomerase [Nitrospinae bacterium]|nr:type I DNA topoisomerase [Nitrospinota bacterium]
MAKGLLVVESPAKAATLKRYLGKDFNVMASMGHIKNLPKSKLGVDIVNGYKPEFVTIKGKASVLKDLKSAAKSAEIIYLAPDPDREGEAIAAHLAEEISGKGKKIYRVLFNEITKKAVTEAIKNVGEINLNKVNAQMARRILDRLMGYKLSPLLWEKVRKGLSAGRVQSVAMRILVEREKEVRAFVPQEYWTIDGVVEGSSPPPFEVKLAQFKGEKIEIGSGEDAAKIGAAIRAAELVIKKIEKKERKRNPYAPFITSTLQQEASRKLRYNARRTMSVAQRLYEGLDVGEEGPVGLITYMRTDSTRVSAEAITDVRGFIEKEFGGQYMPASPNVYKTGKSAQDAHEAIRPTSVERTPEKMKKHLSKEDLAIYELIWKRFVASQMAQAVFDVTSVDITAGEYTMRATGSIMKFAGFLKVYEETKENADESADDSDKRLPADLAEGQRLKLAELKENQHFTQPPPRYTEASLIRELEERGIGRPSTYAGIVGVIQEREYCQAEDRKLIPSELGILVTDLLVENFPDIINVEFTAQMENELDQVEDGQKNWTLALDDFYKPFEADLNKAREQMRNVKAEAEVTEFVCDNCGKPMVIKFGRFGKFLACSGYPECKTTKKLDASGIPMEKKEAPPDEPTDLKCEKCGSPMVIKTGRFGRYMACSRYPECKTTKQIGIGIKCPKPDCGGELTRKRTKTGKTFYGCDNYPKCDFATWDEPVAEACPDCKHPFLVKKSLKSGVFLKCPNKECGYKKQLEEEPSR